MAAVDVVGFQAFADAMDTASSYENFYGKHLDMNEAADQTTRDMTKAKKRRLSPYSKKIFMAKHRLDRVLKDLVSHGCDNAWHLLKVILPPPLQ